ncbi:Hypothetical protein GLP15_2838 [Giardia lamblia P15]|uniref:Uncharacterized protein n=1 Tax=Giardia intestinalis (strain P15) TaxID=658858 RepID=E1F045_GIAIA|nr:Hypothetical protein GLP15_2838 [Giardia lamblia P15]
MPVTCRHHCNQLCVSWCPTSPVASVSPETRKAPQGLLVRCCEGVQRLTAPGLVHGPETHGSRPARPGVRQPGPFRRVARRQEQPSLSAAPQSVVVDSVRGPREERRDHQQPVAFASRRPIQCFLDAEVAGGPEWPASGADTLPRGSYHDKRRCWATLGSAAPQTPVEQGSQHAAEQQAPHGGELPCLWAGTICCGHPIPDGLHPVIQCPSCRLSHKRPFPGARCRASAEQRSWSRDAPLGKGSPPSAGR